MAIPTAAEPLPQTADPTEKKSKTKSVCLMKDEGKAGPSQQEEGPEIIPQLLSLVSCKICEKISAAIWGRAWLLWYQDMVAHHVEPDQREAKELGSLSWDVGIDNWE